MREGADRIWHGCLMDGDLVGEPDLLERSDDASSKFGAYHYVPVDIKSSERLTDAHRCQLVLYGELLAAVQGKRPEDGFIWNGSGARLGMTLREFEQDFHRLLGELRAVVAGHVPPPHLTSGCKHSPWFDECKALAEKSDDIALLYNVKKKSLTALRER
jgi:predicted RecB family nuclease